MNLKKLTNQELKNLFENSQRHGETELARTVILEMRSRGIATRKHYAALEWNQDRVRKELTRFKKVAESVVGNRRKAYTEAGGRKIGRTKTDPKKLWIDSYSAIKTANVNATFLCYVKEPGDEPEFQLHINSKRVSRHNADHLDEALVEWQAIAASATH